MRFHCPGIYHELELGTPDVAIALNSGIFEYDAWHPTIALLDAAAVPFYFTDYSECGLLAASVALQEVHALSLSLPPTLNPFRQPMQRAQIACDFGLDVPWVSNGFIAAVNSKPPKLPRPPRGDVASSGERVGRDGTPLPSDAPPQPSLPDAPPQPSLPDAPPQPPQPPHPPPHPPHPPLRPLPPQPTSPTPLFGGALTIGLVGDWLDASDVRPVPDHQEVWTERGGAQRTLIVEILDLDTVDAPYAKAPRVHFEELAETNGAREASVLSSCALPGALGPRLQAAVGPAWGLRGVQELPDRTRLHVHLRLLRLREQSTDILVSLCRAIAPSSDSQEPPSDADADAETITALVRSLEIEDWGLFG